MRILNKNLNDDIYNFLVDFQTNLFRKYGIDVEDIPDFPYGDNLQSITQELADEIAYTIEYNGK